MPVSGRGTELEFNPQGTLAEHACRRGGNSGFYTKTGVGTVIAEGKEKRISTVKPTSLNVDSSRIFPS